MTRITLYSKPCCHLCDDIKQMIESVRADEGARFSLEVRNILDDAKDFAQYQFAIPVVAINGREVARYRMTSEQFRAALKSS